MRLTFKVATAGERGLTQFPTLRRKGDDYCDSRGILDEAMARRDLGKVEGVLFSSNDGKATIAFCIEFMERIRLTYGRFAESHEGVSVEDASQKARRTTCDRRMAEGRVAYVRVDVSVANGAVRASLSYANPKNVVGESENFAGIVATTFADILIAMRKDIAAENGTGVNLVGGKGCETMFAEREKAQEVRETMERHRDCERRVGGCCSPICPSCGLYENGRCNYGRMAEAG